MEMIDIAYKGYVLTYPRIPLMGGQFVVNISSENRHWLAKIGGTATVITDHQSIEGALTKARRFIDETLAKMRLSS